MADPQAQDALAAAVDAIYLALGDYSGYVATDPTEPDKPAYAALAVVRARLEALKRERDEAREGRFWAWQTADVAEARVQRLEGALREIAGTSCALKGLGAKCPGCLSCIARAALADTPKEPVTETASCFIHGDFDPTLHRCPICASRPTHRRRERSRDR